MGIFSINDLGLDGSVLQMVNHGLVSTTLFLLAGMVERRTLTGELSRLGGMARGRPALATVLLTTGVVALAVPLSSVFAGEFLILCRRVQARLGLVRRRRRGDRARGRVRAPARLRDFSIAKSGRPSPTPRSISARRARPSSCRSLPA